MEKGQSPLADGVSRGVKSCHRGQREVTSWALSTSITTCKKHGFLKVKRLWPRRGVRRGRETLHFTMYAHAWPLTEIP